MIFDLPILELSSLNSSKAISKLIRVPSGKHSALVSAFAHDLKKSLSLPRPAFYE